MSDFSAVLHRGFIFIQQGLDSCTMHHRCHLYILRAYRMLPQVSNPLIGQCRTPPTWWLRCAESALFDVLLPFVFPNSSLPFFLSLSLHLIAFYLNLTPSTSPSLSLHFCCPPPILVSPSSPPTPSPRIQAVISRHSSTSRQLGPIRRGGALTPAFFHSRLLNRLKKN